ncbi:WD repeat-containing protein 44 isoform X5 [Papilio machaon]|uniref:WD repeat-containing protein 44 isoform X5 n=1 Tax=Papilio machaon TaxID=76193 RepID=UPI001E664B4E|nr:WD repeat-containing protein 44 isoform X5 [Papilio machaon]
MGDSSDSEEFYDAEEFTPIKGSKRSSLCKNINVTDGGSPILKEKVPVVKPEELPQPTTHSTPAVEANIEDDRTSVKNVVQGRKRFQELRRCMQTEEEDDGVPDTALPSDHTYTLEHPFKIISHDTMSLQSMTSLGRIGRILSGAAETHSNFRDLVAPSASSREPSTISDDPLASDNRSQNDKVPGSQSQCGEGEDTRSVSTAGDDPIYPRRPDKPQLDDLLVQPPLSHSLNQTMALPSPASTIESLTREFQDSLELSQSKYGNDVSGGVSARECRSSRSSERASGSSRSSTAQRPPHLLHSVLDINEAVRGECVVRAQDEERARSNSRTHSEGRAHAHAHLTAHQQHAQPADIQQTSASLGHARKSVGGRTRRRSAGDSPTVAPALRTRSSSGHQLSDIEILEQVTVLNLDTAGERMPLSVAEHKLPQCINPLSLHIMRLTSEYISSARPQDDDNTRETDEESESVCVGGVEDETKEIKRESTDRQTTAIRRKTEKVLMNDLVKCHSHDNINRRLTGAANSRLKRFFGSTVKRTVDAAKSLAQEVSHARHKEDVADIADDVRGEHNIKLKASNSHKGPYDFDGCVRHVQEMGSGHTGAVWCCKMSVCGRLLATAGQDRLLRVWVTRDAHHMFQDMRTKYNAEKKSSPTPSQESLSLSAPPPSPEAPLGPSAPFCPKPFCVYSGHTSDLLDVSWSKNYFLLSSSMDKTVRLWHISRGECLCCFQHIDFVTAIVFHPRDDRYFLSGSLDGKLRLWNIPDKKVAVWNEVDGKTKLITAANFCQNGKFAVVGTYDGRCIFYTTDQLKYHTQIDVRSTRGKNSTGRKISGIEPMPNDDKILVTSNDSRIRLYDLRDLNLSCKYKGYVNVSSQIKASFSHDGKYIVSGSENQCIYIWKTYHDYSKFSSVRRDRNDFWEGIKAHNAVVTCAVFAPNPDHMIRMIAEREAEANMADKTPEEREEAKAAEGGMVSSSQTGHVLVSADFNGCIKVFVHKAKPKHSSLPASALA